MTTRASAPEPRADGESSGVDRRRVQALIEIGRLVALGPNEPAILEHVTEAVARLVGSPYARLWMVDDPTGDLVLAATAGPLTSAHDVGMRRSASLRNLNMAVLESGSAHQTSDVGSDPRWFNHATTERLGLHSYLGVPLQGGGQRYGIMTLLFSERRVFDRDELELIESVATQVTLALQHARLYTDARTRARQLAAVLNVTKRLALGPDLDEILARITEEAARLLAVEGATLRLLEGDELVRVATSGLGGAFVLGDRLRAGESLMGRVVAEDHTIFSADPSDDPRHAPESQAHARALGLRCWLGVPLRGRDRVVGALSVFGTEARRFDDAEVGLLEAFAGQAAIAVENARALEREQERRSQLEAVRQVAAEITRELDLTTLLELITRRATELVGAASGVVCLWDEASQLLIPRASYRMGPEVGRVSWRLGEGAIGTAARDRRGLIVNDYRGSPYALRRITEQSDITALLVEPLLYRDRLVGGIAVTMKEGGRAFADCDRELLGLFADHAAVAVENARLYAEVQALTLTDPLTGIANRRHFDPKLAEEIARADRGGAPLGLLILDIDGFKAYNDAHGHQAGDEVLRRLADVLSRAVRSTDFVARYGGEEFAILLPGTDAPGAHALGEKVRRAVAAAPLGVTISVGGAVCASGKGASAAALITAADAALYQAKRSGRNRTLVA